MGLVLSILVLAALAALAVWVFNRLVGLRNRAANAWADIAVQLKRRHDLVANLVETVKGYSAHERGTLEAVVAARERAVSATEADRPREAGPAEGRLTSELRTLFALAESYPALRADESFLELHRSLVEIEDHLQNARRYYNAVVRDLNTRIQSFPDLLVARALGFREREFFQLDDASEAEAPAVSL